MVFGGVSIRAAAERVEPLGWRDACSRSSACGTGHRLARESSADDAVTQKLMAMETHLASLVRASELHGAEAWTLRTQLREAERRRLAAQEEQQEANRTYVRRGSELRELQRQLADADARLQEGRSLARDALAESDSARRALESDFAAKQAVASSLCFAERALAAARAEEQQRWDEGCVSGSRIEPDLLCKLEGAIQCLHMAGANASEGVMYGGVQHGEHVAAAVEELASLAALALHRHALLLEAWQGDAGRLAAVLPPLLNAGRTLSRSSAGLLRRTRQLGLELAAGRPPRCTRPGARSAARAAAAASVSCSGHGGGCALWGGAWVPLNEELPEVEHALATWRLAAAAARATLEGEPAAHRASSPASPGAQARGDATRPRNSAQKLASAPASALVASSSRSPSAGGSAGGSPGPRPLAAGHAYSAADGVSSPSAYAYECGSLGPGNFTRVSRSLEVPPGVAVLGRTASVPTLGIGVACASNCGGASGGGIEGYRPAA